MSHSKGYLDLYTLNEPLTHKAKFWSWYIRALKGLPLYTRTGKWHEPPLGFYATDALPKASFIRHPWWWDIPELRPYAYPFDSTRGDYKLRNSYLSPVNRRYVWSHHPVRPNESESDFVHFWPQPTPWHSRDGGKDGVLTVIQWPKCQGSLEKRTL